MLLVRMRMLALVVVVVDLLVHLVLVLLGEKRFTSRGLGERIGLDDPSTLFFGIFMAAWISLEIVLYPLLFFSCVFDLIASYAYDSGEAT
jgi:hypothetical protein